MGRVLCGAHGGMYEGMCCVGARCPKGKRVEDGCGQSCKEEGVGGVWSLPYVRGLLGQHEHQLVHHAGDGQQRGGHHEHDRHSTRGSDGHDVPVSTNTHSDDRGGEHVKESQMSRRPTRCHKKNSGSLSKDYTSQPSLEAKTRHGNQEDKDRPY
jgi:hypothetical protein